MNIISPRIFVNRNAYPSFRGAVEALPKPAVKPSSASCLKLFNDIYQKSKGNETVKTVTIEDRGGVTRDGVIIRQRSEEEKVLPIGSQPYSMYINGLKAGTINLSDDAIGGATRVNGLYVKPYSGDNYKGVGTELLKFAVEHSIEQGFGGKLSLHAFNGKSPVEFYYKNNLRISRKNNEKAYPALTARVDYAIRHGLEPEQVLNFPNNLCLDLDRTGAYALLAGERLCEDTLSETMYSETFENKNGRIFEADIDFCDITNDDWETQKASGNKVLGEYVIQIMKKGTGKDKNGDSMAYYMQIAHLSAVKTKNEDGKRVLSVKDVNVAAVDSKLSASLRMALLKAIAIKADDLDVDDIEFGF